MSRNAPNVAFLGVCERALYSATGQPHTWKHNVLGLRSIILFYVFPVSLQGFQMVLGVYNPSDFEPTRIRVLDPDGEELFHIDLKLEVAASLDGSEGGDSIGPYFVDTAHPTWVPFVWPMQDVSALIQRPGQYRIVLAEEDEDISLGCLNVGYAEPPPLTADRIEAIRSSPHAAKRVRFVIKCNECDDEIVSYAGLERDEDEEQAGVIWYRELPTAFKCKCEKNNIDLGYLRANLHALLGQPVVHDEESIPSGHFSFERLYEENALELVCNQFDELLSREPIEGEILRFIRENPILLHRFSPARVFYEVPILTKYRADVVILTTNRDLLLIELEKAQTRLLKKDGGMAAEMRHAFDQVRDWLHVTEDHKLAVLDCMDLEPDSVGSIRGIVILGRDADYPPEHLRRLRWEDYGRTAFYTYDDILRDLTLLRKEMGGL
jgi:hypothetical protein